MAKQILTIGYIPKKSKLSLLECLEVQANLHTDSYVRAECICGNHVILTEHAFRYAIIKSCGCLRKKIKIPKKKIYGKFNLVSPTEDRDSGGHIIWLIQCIDCKEITKNTLSNLKCHKKLACKNCAKLNL